MLRGYLQINDKFKITLVSSLSVDSSTEDVDVYDQSNKWERSRFKFSCMILTTIFSYAEKLELTCMITWCMGGYSDMMMAIGVPPLRKCQCTSLLEVSVKQFRFALSFNIQLCLTILLALPDAGVPLQYSGLLMRMKGELRYLSDIKPNTSLYLLMQKISKR